MKSILTIPGQSFVANGVSSNFGAAYLILDPFHDRRDPALGAEHILGGLCASGWRWRSWKVARCSSCSAGRRTWQCGRL